MRHEARGEGTIVELMADGRVKVLFDAGDEHRYKRTSWHKLTPVESGGEGRLSSRSRMSRMNRISRGKRCGCTLKPLVPHT